MRSARFVAVMSSLVVLASCGSSTSESTPVDELTVSGAWARTTPATATNGVVYFRISSPDEVAIVGASVEPAVAATAELHETMTSGGESPMANMPEMADDVTMEMTPVDSVVVAADQTVVFEPGGKHVMLTGLAAPLVDGDSFTLTLALSDGTSVEVPVEVADSEPTPSG